MREITFEEFVNNLTEGIKKNLPEDLKEAKIDVVTTIKNNDTKVTGLCIRVREENLTPTIYVAEYYKDYVNNKMDLEEIIKEVIDLRIKFRKEKKMDMNWIEDFDQVKGKIIPTFAGLEENNKAIMEMCPYVKILDMIMIFRIVVDIDGNDKGMGSIVVKDDMQNKWRVTTQTLFETALKNAKGSFKIRSMFETVSNMVGSENVDKEVFKEDLMYVITNKSMMYGAAAIIDEEFMWDVYDKIGGDFYIIPSSVHELIALPFSKVDEDTDFINDMIKTVNKTQLEEKDVLSDHAYKFTKENGLEMCE